MDSDSPSRRLAAPGAGLPKIELFFARIIFSRFRRKTSREEATAIFADERDHILKLAGNLAPDVAARQVLIRRLPGMEDSSRDWSVFMTVEHLRIVNAAVTGCIRELVAGQVPPGAASTAAVKPARGIDAAVLPSFSQGCDDLLGLVSSLPDLRTVERYSHPWFGHLDAADWHAMAAFHMRLHRKQIERIIGSIS